MCLNEVCGKVRIGKHLSDNFQTQNVLKQGDALLPLLYSFSLEHAFRKVHENQVELVYTDDVNVLRDNIDTIKTNAETLIDASKEVGLEVNAKETKYTRYTLLSPHWSAGQNHDIKIPNGSFETVA
jgi:hypothetical protein